MKLINQSKEKYTAEEFFLLTKSPLTKKMKDAVGTTVEIKEWCIYEDIDNKGQEQLILSILTPENEVLATNSPTFQREFIDAKDICEFCDTNFTSVKVLSGMSKSGREFITCSL